MYESLVAAFLGSTAAFLLWKYFVYPLFLSPLASVPAVHPIARISTLWIDWQRLRGRDFQTISAAFEFKGDYVVVSPREIALNDIDAVNCVWGIGATDFDKHPSYDYWATQGSLNTFTSVLGPEHRRRHKRIRGVHNRSFIGSSIHIREIMRNLMIEKVYPAIENVSTSTQQTTNLLPLALSIILDCTSAFAFGVPLALDFVTDTKAREEWWDLFLMAFPTDQASFWLREHPIVTKYLCMLGVPLVSKETATARRQFESWALPQVDAAEEVLKRRDKGETIKNGQLPILYDAVRSDLVQSRPAAEKSFNPTLEERRELASECLDHVAFTAEAFGTVFTYIVYELSHHRNIQSALREELRSIENPFFNSETPTDVPDSNTLERLPLLGAVIKESLRLRNTSPNADPRVTPSNSSCRVGNLSKVPPNTRICSFGWCLHRNPNVYTDPLTWDPYRWLDGGSDDAAAAKKWFFAFGAGSRKCIGQHIAVDLMRFSIVTLYSRFSTHVADETAYPGRNNPMSSNLSENLQIKFQKLPILSAAEKKTFAVSEIDV